MALNEEESRLFQMHLMSTLGFMPKISLIRTMARMAKALSRGGKDGHLEVLDRYLSLETNG